MGRNTKINRTELAQLFGVSLGTVDRWVKQGCPSARTGNGWQFDPAEVFRWNLAQAKGGTSDSARLTKARADKETANAALAQLALEKATSELLDAAAVTRWWASFALTIQARLLDAAPGRIARQVVGEQSERAITDAVRAEMRECLESLARLTVEQMLAGDADVAGEEAETPAE